MTENPLVKIVESEAIGLLMQLFGTIPGWEGPTKTQFERDLRQVVADLEHAEEQINKVMITELALKAATEGLA